MARLSAIAAILAAALVGFAPAASAAAPVPRLDVHQGASSDVITIQHGTQLPAGLTRVHIDGAFDTPTEATDVETVRLLQPDPLQPTTLGDVDTQLGTAVGPDRFASAEAMQWFEHHTDFNGGLPSPGSVDYYKVFRFADTYYEAQITAGRVQATAQPFTVHGTTHAVLPWTNQSVHMLPNDTFAVCPAHGTAPVLHRGLVRVSNDSRELHFVRVLPIKDGATVDEVKAALAGTGPNVITGAVITGVGTQSGGNSVVLNLQIPSGHYALVDFLPHDGLMPDGVTPDPDHAGVSHAFMGMLVTVDVI